VLKGKVEKKPMPDQKKKKRRKGTGKPMGRTEHKWGRGELATYVFWEGRGGGCIKEKGETQNRLKRKANSPFRKGCRTATEKKRTEGREGLFDHGRREEKNTTGKKGERKRKKENRRRRICRCIKKKNGKRIQQGRLKQQATLMAGSAGEVLQTQYRYKRKIGLSAQGTKEKGGDDE